MTRPTEPTRGFTARGVIGFTIAVLLFLGSCVASWPRS